jgi:integrase
MPRQHRSLKRSDGEGTISKRRDKNGETIGYKGAVTVGLTLAGIPERRWVSGLSEAEVREKIETIKHERNIGMLANTEGIRVDEYLQRWVQYKESDGTRVKTTFRYAHTVRHKLIPLLGRLKLEKLRPLDVEHALRIVRQNVSAKEARRTRLVLSMALNQAVRWQMLPRNVCQAVKPPAIPAEEDKDVRFWTPDQAKLFLEHLRNHRLVALFYTGLMTGLRPCELLGLRWCDVDFETNALRIEQDAVCVQGRMLIGPVKTKASRRRVTISKDTVQAIREHRARQLLERHAAQEGYVGSGLVFASEIGTVTNYTNLKRVLLESVAQIAILHWQQAGLIEPGRARNYARYRALLLEHPELKRQMPVNEMGLHGMRHTHASVLIRRGLNAKIVSDRLGHTSVAFTLQKYVHLYEEQRREAAISMDDFLGVDVDNLLEDANVSSVPCPCGSGKMFDHCHGSGNSGA